MLVYQRVNLTMFIPKQYGTIGTDPHPTNTWRINTAKNIKTAVEAGATSELVVAFGSSFPKNRSPKNMVKQGVSHLKLWPICISSVVQPGSHSVKRPSLGATSFTSYTWYLYVYKNRDCAPAPSSTGLDGVHCCLELMSIHKHGWKSALEIQEMDVFENGYCTAKWLQIVVKIC